MNEKLKMTDNNAEVIRMKRKYQWILCAGLIIFVIAAFCVLVSKDNKEEVKGAFVREGGYQSECLYQSASRSSLFLRETDKRRQGSSAV